MEDFQYAVSMVKKFEMINKLSWANVILSDQLLNYLSSSSRSSIDNNSHSTNDDCNRIKDKPKSTHTTPNYLNLCTQVCCYNLMWTLNPCRINRVGTYRDSNCDTCYEIVYSTLAGHLIEGCERISIKHRAKDGCVSIDLASNTRGNGLLGTISMPFIVPIQHRFFKGILNNVDSLMKER